MNAPMPRRLWRAAMAAAVCVAGPAAFQPGRQTAMAATLTTSGRSASFACQGVHDFLVDGGQRTLDGANTFAHVCVQDGGTLLVDNALTLRTGALYVDATSRVTANGLPGNGECAAVGDSGSPGGGDGVALTVLAREAIILGTISDDGGAGVASDPSSCQSFGYSAVGGGGAGGAVMIEAAALTLGGTISALGGPGASAGKRHGAAGAAGRITIRVTHSSPGARDLRRYLRAGHNVAIATLTARQATALPAFVPEPVPSRITTLGAAPAQAPFPSPAVVSQLQQCGQSDLIVRGSMSLAGIHYYPHVCIEKNGSLRTPSRLTLQAQTILIAAGGSLSADEVVAQSSDGTGTGRYPGGAAPINRAAPPAGMPGASSPADGQAVTPPAGGAAGGRDRPHRPSNPTGGNADGTGRRRRGRRRRRPRSTG